jgi:hypothetical protein
LETDKKGMKRAENDVKTKSDEESRRVMRLVVQALRM